MLQSVKLVSRSKDTENVLYSILHLMQFKNLSYAFCMICLTMIRWRKRHTISSSVCKIIWQTHCIVKIWVFLTKAWAISMTATLFLNDEWKSYFSNMSDSYQVISRRFRSTKIVIFYWLMMSTDELFFKRFLFCSH